MLAKMLGETIMLQTQTATAERIGGPHPQPTTHAELLDVKAVGQLLGCSARHVYRLSDSGKMPRPMKLGALVRWNRSAVLAWIADGCQPVRRAGR
jgi:excisionase family DNA binding protein